MRSNMLRTGLVLSVLTAYVVRGPALVAGPSTKTIDGFRIISPPEHSDPINREKATCPQNVWIQKVKSSTCWDSKLEIATPECLCRDGYFLTSFAATLAQSCGIDELIGDFGNHFKICEATGLHFQIVTFNAVPVNGTKPVRLERQSQDLWHVHS